MLCIWIYKFWYQGKTLAQTGVDTPYKDYTITYEVLQEADDQLHTALDTAKGRLDKGKEEEDGADAASDLAFNDMGLNDHEGSNQDAQANRDKGGDEDDQGEDEQGKDDDDERVARGGSKRTARARAKPVGNNGDGVQAPQQSQGRRTRSNKKARR